MSGSRPHARPPVCAACGRDPGSSLACMACGALAPEPAGATHFHRLGLPISVRVDADALEDHYLRLSRHLHPDFQVGRDDEVQRLSLAHSALLNEAREVLEDDHRRAEYLLSLHDPDALERHKTLSQAFLMEGMELSERAEEARAARDEEALAGLAREVGAEIGRRMEELMRPESWTAPDAARLATLIHEVKVFRRILDDTEALV